MIEKDQIQDLYWWAQDKVRGFQTGLHRSPDFGYSIEFAQHRAYVPGDSPKHIDWAVLAKTDRYLTKQYEAESNLRSYMVADTSSSMNFPDGEHNKLSQLIKVLALSGVLLEKQRDAMGLLEVNEGGAAYFEAKVSHTWTLEMLDHLSGVQKGNRQTKNANLAESLKDLISRIPKRSQVLLFTDVFIHSIEDVVDACAQLSHEGHDVRWAILYSSSEELKATTFAGKIVEDLETGLRRYLSRDDANAFSSFVNEQLQKIQQLSRQKGIPSILLDTDEGALVMLHKFLLNESIHHVK